MSRAKRRKKSASQLFTFFEIAKNNKDIFVHRFPRQYDEPDNHYICKVYLGEMLKKYYKNKYMMVINYEHNLPTLYTDGGDKRTYIPDIYVEFINHDGDKKTIHIADIEINGKIHYKNKHHYNKNKLRRETILNYYNSDNYKDNRYPEYEIKFSYIVFDTDDFLFNKFDFFREIFEEKFIHGGIYPEIDLYEKYLL